jgi:hypothetical protein
VTARYQYLPWVREGAANAYRNPDDLKPVLQLPGGKPLTALPVTLEINDTRDADVSLRLYGPGDVTGIDARVVIRVDPPPRTADLEPNYLVSIEFDSPDFPWLFTPAAAGGKERLRPWLCLVAPRRLDAVRVGRSADTKLPVLTTPVSELPDLAESWAWAHAQAVQVEDAEPVLDILATQPDRNLSRLLCPRRLEPETAYLACLVPAFEAGRKAGLGIAVTEGDENRLAPAWDGSQPIVQLPVYFLWEFSTGIGGDFESLARRLTGRRLDGEVGRRPLRVGTQPFGLPDLGVREFAGPLLAPSDRSPAPVDATFQSRLRDLLNLGASVAAPVVTPPVYGSWQAGQAVVPTDGELPRWLRELNLDPSVRAAAGLGARVVMERQEQLVASAWRQLGDGLEVRRLEHRRDLAIAVLGSVVRRRVEPMETGRMLQFLGPAQRRLRASTETLQARVARANLPPSFSSPSFRRALRPAGTLSRRRSPAKPSLQKVATKVGTTIPPASLPATTKGQVSDPHVQAQLDKLSGTLTATLRRYREATQALRDYAASFTRRPVAAQLPSFQFTANFKAQLVASVDPRQTVTRRFRARVSGPTGSALARPSFPQPMYEALRDLSTELLLPGAGQIDAETVTLLESNPSFIEAYMLGLNHALAGELLWREFPGDVRHTYFRAFWDTRGTAQPLGPLPPIDTWKPEAGLGDSFGQGQEQLILLIRGELLQRYPDALISAVKAKTLTSLGNEQRFPIFRGRIEPDITFLGFDLTEEQARGGLGQLGWFFVIQEQPTAPRFGLDETRTKPLTTWNDLAWSDLRTVPGAHLRLADLKVPAAQRPAGPVWSFNSAHMAAILRQRPVRVAFHARRLLPPPSRLPPPRG